MGANIKLVSLSQFKRLGFNAGIKCWCGRMVTVDPAYLYRVAQKHNLAGDKIAQIKSKLKCSMCGAIGKCKIGWSSEEPGHVSKPGWARPDEPSRPLG